MLIPTLPQLPPPPSAFGSETISVPQELKTLWLDNMSEHQATQVYRRGYQEATTGLGPLIGMEDYLQELYNAGFVLGLKDRNVRHAVKGAHRGSIS